MRRLYFLTLCILSFSGMTAQEELSKEEKQRRQNNIDAANPFKQFGYKAKVATLSKGKYLEVHDLDSIVTIGSVRFHVEKMKIVGVVVPDSTDREFARPIGDVASRWLSPDPLAEEYPDWTPYRFGFNNPIRFNDPTGLLEEDWIPSVDDNGAVTYTAEKGDSAKSLSDQYGVTQEKAEKITGTKGSEEIKEGTKVSGDKVKQVTGSEVLKLDATSNTMTDQDVVFQTLFAFRRERILDSQSSNPDYTANVNDYFKNTKQRMSGTAGGAEYGLTTNARKPTTLLINGQRVTIHLSFSGVNDGLFSTGYGSIQNLPNGNSNINFLHPSSYPSDITKRPKRSVPSLNIVTNDPSTLLKYIKN